MYLLLFLQQLISSGTHIIAKSLTYSMEPATILFFRASMSAILFICWMLYKRGKISFERKDLWTIIALGALNIPINQFLFLKSMEYTSPPNVALAYALTPAFVFIIAVIFLKEKITWLKVVGIVVAIGGTAVILFEKGIKLTPDGIYGDVLALGAAFSFALFTIIGKKMASKYGAGYATGLAMITGYILYLPVYALTSSKLTIVNINLVNWAQIFYLGVITSGLGYALWYYALKKIDAAKVSVFNNIQPILTTLLSVAFLGTSITIPFVIGGSLIICGVILTQRG